MAQDRAPRPIDSDEVMRLLMLRTASDTGQSFFDSLVRNLAGVLHVAGAWVTEYVPDERRLRGLACWMHGRAVPPFDYDISGTPCEAVICERRFSQIEEDALKQFPRDTALLEWGAVSYLGVPLFDEKGMVVGHLGAFDTQAIPSQPEIEKVFTAVAVRANAELLRLRAVEQLRGREAQLAGLVDTAMDAIFILNQTAEICRVNAAALRLLDCEAEDLLGENFTAFLDERSERQFRLFLNRVADEKADGGALWVPQSLRAARWDRTTFPAEMTLSRFRTDDAWCFSVILRNINERVDAERRIAELSAEAEYLRKESRSTPGLREMIGCSTCMRRVFESIERVAPLNSTVLIQGETGTGKEIVARAIHQGSGRARKPLVKVNCAAIPAALMESEFFGHEKGAFTGATGRRIGRFAEADGGTLFLDELGELSLDLQAKLLRVIQDGEFQMVGGTGSVKVDVRLIAATHCDLAARVKDGRFRADLFYRLNVFPLELPPLRERGADVELLAEALIERLAKNMGRIVAKLDDGNRRVLRDYAWPGNVRELRNVIERALILSQSANLDLRSAMPPAYRANAQLEPETPPAREAGLVTAPILTMQGLRELEARNLRAALKAAGGKISGANGAAQRIGVPASTFASRLKALGVGFEEHAS